MPEKPAAAQWAPPPRVVRDYPYRTDSSGYLTPGETHVFVVGIEGGAPRQITRGNGDWGARDEAPAGWVQPCGGICGTCALMGMKTCARGSGRQNA